MLNIAVQTHRSQALVFSATFVTIGACEHRFDPKFDICWSRHRDEPQHSLFIPDIYDCDANNEAVQHARAIYCTCDDHSITNTCDARQERAAAHNARAIGFNKQIVHQPAAEELLSREGNIVFVRVP